MCSVSIHDGQKGVGSSSVVAIECAVGGGGGAPDVLVAS